MQSGALLFLLWQTERILPCVVSYAVLHSILILLSPPCQVSSFHMDKLVGDTPFSCGSWGGLISLLFMSTCETLYGIIEAIRSWTYSFALLYTSSSTAMPFQCSNHLRHDLHVFSTSTCPISAAPTFWSLLDPFLPKLLLIVYVSVCMQWKRMFLIELKPTWYLLQSPWEQKDSSLSSTISRRSPIDWRNLVGYPIPAS